MSNQRSMFLWGILLVFLLGGIAIRIININDFQLGDRQYRSALIARAFYLSANQVKPEWRRQVAETSQQRAGILEPPIMELMVSWVYRFLKGEFLWISGFLSSVFWVIGGVFLFNIVLRIVSIEAAVFATGYYLFTPMGIFISTGFVPDPLMIMLFLLGIILIIRYQDKPSKANLVVAAIVCALAIFVKPFCLFAILGAFLSLSIIHKNGWRQIADFHSLSFVGIILLPIIYYAYGISVGGYLSRQAQGSFLPELLLTRSYWQDWLLTAVRVTGFTPLIAALIGLPALPRGMPRALLIGLSIGYIVFCLIFSYHIRFGPHYHSQLIIIVAISMGSLIAVIFNQFRQLPNMRYSWPPVAGALFLVAIFNFRELRSTMPVNSSTFVDAAVAREIGEIVNHSNRVVYLAPYYGTPLEYYGELSGVYWPRSSSDRDQALGISRKRGVAARLNEIAFDPEYFIITNFNEYNNHHADLKEYLTTNCYLVAQSEAYLIYGVCEK